MRLSVYTIGVYIDVPAISGNYQVCSPKHTKVSQPHPDLDQTIFIFREV